VPALTKIVATIGPASCTPAVVAKLVDAGVSVFRFNFGHGTLEEHAARLATIRRASRERERPVAVLGDLQGPKIRLGEVAGDGIAIATGATIVFQRRPIVAAPDAAGGPIRFGCTYPGLADDVEPGQRVLVNDGAVRALVIDKQVDELICTVTQGGPVSTGKGLNLPDTDLAIETLTERDWMHAEWAIDHDLDFLALSFVRCAADVERLAAGITRLAEERGHRHYRLPIIAKIEVPRALREIESIVDAADGIMVARGDLGVEMDLAEVPVIQKRLIAIAQEYGKPCIVATQMFESMIQSPTPTRAEVNDVAGAIFDQADAVMLSGETAVGRYPVVAVEHMRRVAERTEAFLAAGPAVPSPPARLVRSRYRTAALAHGVWTVAQDVGATCIVVWSQSGGGARYLSQNNFHVPIIAVTSDLRAARQMQLLRGVTPLVTEVPESLGAWSREIDDLLRRTGRAAPGDVAILVAGAPLGRRGATNRMAILVVGDPATGFAG
jgi:pyruvate kinase